MRRPGIEPESQEWESCMIPLHHRCALHHTAVGQGEILLKRALKSQLCPVAHWSHTWRHGTEPMAYQNQDAKPMAFIKENHLPLGCFPFSCDSACPAASCRVLQHSAVHSFLRSFHFRTILPSSLMHIHLNVRHVHDEHGSRELRATPLEAISSSLHVSQLCKNIRVKWAEGHIEWEERKVKKKNSIYKCKQYSLR